MMQSHWLFEMSAPIIRFSRATNREEEVQIDTKYLRWTYGKRDTTHLLDANNFTFKHLDDECQNFK